MDREGLRKKYVALEVVIRCGKTTQLMRLVERLRSEKTAEVFVTREPGGGQIADHLRETVQGSIFAGFSENMTHECEAALYSASRAQMVPGVITRSLSEGKIVISDRSALTSIAYQGAGRDLGIQRIFSFNNLILNGFWPGLGIFIDTDLEVAMQRFRNVREDKFEAFGKDFFVKARQAYLQMPELMKGITEIEIVDGNGSIEEVHERVWSVAVGFLGLK